MKEKFDVIPTGSIIVQVISNDHVVYPCNLMPQELISNAILYEVIERKGITKNIFKFNHPSGAIGEILKTE